MHFIMQILICNKNTEVNNSKTTEAALGGEEGVGGEP